MVVVFLLLLPTLVMGLVEPSFVSDYRAKLIDPRYYEALEYFEEHLQVDAMRNNSVQGSVVDIRVAKALGKKGYNKLRISVITYGHPIANGADTDINFTYSAPFKYRWEYSYDLGLNGFVCDEESVISSRNVSVEGDCLLTCNRDSSCAYFSYLSDKKLCKIANDHCVKLPHALPSATYERKGRRYLNTGIVEVEPGNPKTFVIEGWSYTFKMPLENAGTQGVIFGDPCFSSKWAECVFSEKWATFNSTYRMINAVAKDESIDFVQLLGDNFYDQDGRLTQAITDKYSGKALSLMWQTVPGNHDFWVMGWPGGEQPSLDQYGYGFLQFYGQDSLVPLTKTSAYDFSVDPDKPKGVHNGFRNKVANFLWYHKIGNIGFIGYSGAGQRDETLKGLKEACEYFHESAPQYIFVAAHWNIAGGGCDSGMETPAIRKSLLSFKGCDVGNRLKFTEGHTHCNSVQEAGNGFLLGAHGMDDKVHCSEGQYGFGFVDTTHDNKIRLYYFPEKGPNFDNTDKLIDCMEAHGSLYSCVHLSKLWFEEDLPSQLPEDGISEIM